MSTRPPPEPPRWNATADAAERSTRPPDPGAHKPAPPVKQDQSAAGEEDPGSALDSLDGEANGQPATPRTPQP